LRWIRRNRPAIFKGRLLEAEIIVVCVGWYLRFGLSLQTVHGACMKVMFAPPVIGPCSRRRSRTRLGSASVLNRPNAALD
jgi:hypothetical protein